MAQYTIELRNVIKDYNLFDFNYEFWNESERERLENKFILHYYFSEIAHETVNKFKMRLKAVWLLNIDKYNKLFEANAKELDILYNSTGDATNKIVYKDTPITEFDTSDEYATNITYSEGKTKSLTGLTQVEALEIYNKKLQDITLQFLDEFRNLFMKIY